MCRALMRCFAIATIYIGMVPGSALAQPSDTPSSFVVPDDVLLRSALRQLLLTEDPTAPLRRDTTTAIALSPVQLPDKTQAHPTPPSTGFRAFVRATGADFKAFPQRRSTWVILGIGAASALAAHPEDDEVNAHIVGSDAVGKFFAPGKWIGAAWVQAGTSLGLYFGGRYLVPAVEGEPRTNKISHLGMDLLRAQILSQAFIHSVKYTIRRDRPTGECCSFPSGHAATAFAAASVLERHLGYRAAWPTLVIATYVGVSRLHDNRHFLSDILFGSAIGMATGWTVVGRHGRDEYALLPMPVKGGMGIALTRVGTGERRADVERLRRELR